MRKVYKNSHYSIYNADCLGWLPLQKANSFHAVVTDPPFSTLEYSPKELRKRRKEEGGVWRLPQAFDKAVRQPVPRFTILNEHDHIGVLAFHLRLAPELHRVLVPGAHVFIASHPLLSHLVAQAFCMAGFEARGQIIRVVKTLRGGDRPKANGKLYRDMSVIPKSCFEPWLLFRKPCRGRVADNLVRYGTGALRRPNTKEPFADLLNVSQTRGGERQLGDHPSLKPQALMRKLVRAALPLAQGVILDPFMGAGSTIAAAKSQGLQSVGVEIDDGYFKLAHRAIPKLARLKGV